MFTSLPPKQALSASVASESRQDNPELPSSWSLAGPSLGPRSGLAWTSFTTATIVQTKRASVCALPLPHRSPAVQGREPPSHCFSFPLPLCSLSFPSSGSCPFSFSFRTCSNLLWPHPSRALKGLLHGPCHSRILCVQLGRDALREERGIGPIIASACSV